MSTNISNLSTVLANFPAFAALSLDDLDWLSHNVNLYNCNIGQTLLLPDRLPDTCYCVVQGKGRLLHHDPSLRRPVTLAYAQPGDLVGWAGLIRRSPCEWVTAASSLKLIGFSAEIFYELEARSSSFRSWLDASNSPAELIDILKSALRSRPNAEPDEREVMRNLVPYMKLLSARDTRELPNESNSLFLWNSQHPDFNLPIGENLDPELLKSIPPGFPLRIFTVDADRWRDQMRPPLKNSFQSSPNSLVDVLEGDRYNDLLVTSPSPLTSETATTPTTSNIIAEDIIWKGKKLQVLTGNTPADQILASLGMLSSFYNVPFRKDIISRAARESLRNQHLSLELLGNLSTILGFIGNISVIPTAQLVRLSFPCFCLVDGNYAFIHDINNGVAKAIFPAYGKVKVPLHQLIGDEAGLRVLTLSPGRDSQQKKLNFSWFLPQIKKYKRSLIEVLAASLVLQLLNLAQPLVLQQIFDKVIVQQNLDTLYTLGVVLLGVSLFQGLISAVRTYLFADTTNRIDIALGAQVIQHLLRLPLRYFDRRPVGELQTRIAELGNIRSFLTGSLLTLVLDSVFSIIYIAVMFVYSGVLTAVTLGVIPLFLGITVFASPIIRGQLRKAAERNASTQSFLVESLNGVQTIKAQNAEANVRWQWQRRYSAYMSENFRTLMIGVSAGTVSGFLSQLTSLLTLWVGAYLVIQGDLTIGQLIAFRIISGYVVGPLLNIATSWQSFQGVALSMERLSDVIDTHEESGSEESDQLPLPDISGEVRFQEVDFTFNEGSPLVVNSVSFTIQSGSFVGIVGRSGSGKSTIMKLLPRLYQPTSGRILIDGYDIAKLQLGSVRRQIGIVPQDSLLFEGTIRENIALTLPDASYDDIVSAAKVACAHDFIMEQPEGYATRIGERGTGLSGGQRQRIAIARAVLQRPSLLILDEATSALDYLTERQVCINLKNTFQGSTVFFITHRLSTIRSADLILMMDSGHLVEQGTHQELLDSHGRYYALYSQQEADID